MASGGTYTIEARLVAVDQMTGKFMKAGTAAEKLNGSLKSSVVNGMAMGVGMKVVSTAMTAVASSVGSAAQRFDTLNRFPKTMQNLGVSASDASKALKTIDKGIEGLPTTLDDAASATSRLTAKSGDVGKASKYFVAMNDAIVAGGASTEIQSSAVEQLSQAYSKGKPDMMEWRSMLTAMPGQLRQVASSMGMTTDELGEGLRGGTISMDEFMDKLVELDNKGANGFASFHDQAQSAVGGITTQVSLLGTAITRGLANMMTAIDNSLSSSGLPTISQMIANFRTVVDNAFKGINNIIAQIDWKGSIEVATPYWNAFKAVAITVINVVKTLFTLMARFSNVVTALAITVGLAVIALKGIAIVKSIVGAFTSFGTAITGMASNKGLASLPAKLFATGKAETSVGQASQMSAKQTLAMGAAILMIGLGVTAAGAGLLLMAQAAVTLASGGLGAVAVMVGMAAALAGLVLLVSTLGPALVVGAAGFLALGVAILAIGAGIAIASAGLTLMSSALPTIATYGTTAAVGLAALGASMLVIGAGAIVAAAGLTVLSAGIIVFSAGLVVLSAALVAGAVVIAAFSAALLIVSAAMLVLAVSTKLVATTVKTIATNAKRAASSLKAMQSSVKTANAGIEAIGSKAKSAMSALISAFSNAAGKASSSGTKLGNGFTKGMKSGLSSAKSAAKSAVTSINSTLKSGSSKAYSCGRNISLGLAKGMRSALSSVTAAANALVKQADKATKAKAKVHSPSRVFMKTGRYFGEGLAIGIEQMSRTVAKASEHMVNIPNAKMSSFDGSMDSDYLYGMNAQYTVEVPMYVNGKEFARATASDTQAVQNRMTKLQNRKAGLVGV